jgi:hypothetical protein
MGALLPLIIHRSQAKTTKNNKKQQNKTRPESVKGFAPDSSFSSQKPRPAAQQAQAT